MASPLAWLRMLIAGQDAHQPAPSTRQHLAMDALPTAIYAIGDIHGCLAQLQDLEAQIYAEAEAWPGEKWLVYLGDYIDRGPRSAAVLDHLLARPPTSFRRICLAGNHEVMALAFFERPVSHSRWLEFGGLETLQSYGIPSDRISRCSDRELRAIVDSYIPREHIGLLRSLPASLQAPGYVFVHAGLRPGVPITNQSEDDLFWIRDEFFDAAPANDYVVVHGHTPNTNPVVAPGRFGIDTGAYATGTLTALRIRAGGTPAFLSATIASI